MDDAHGTFHGNQIGSFHKVVQAHGGNGDGIRDGGLKFHVPAKNVQAFHAEAAKAGYFHGSRGHYLMHHKKHAPNEQFSEGQEDYLPPDATPVTMAGPVIAPLVQFREEVVEQFAEGYHVKHFGRTYTPRGASHGVTGEIGGLKAEHVRSHIANLKEDASLDVHHGGKRIGGAYKKKNRNAPFNMETHVDPALEAHLSSSK